MKSYILISTLLYTVGWLFAIKEWNTFSSGSKIIMGIWLILILWGLWVLHTEGL